MTIRHRWVIAALATMTLLAAACSNAGSGSGSGGSTGASGSSGSSVPDNSGTTIKIAVNAWTGSAANATVAKLLLEKYLGYTVDLTKIDEFAQFPALARGELDATLEIWPSGHADDYNKYIKGNAGVVDGGKLGVIGQIGWWLPTYMVQEHPELKTWKGLNQDASLFATAETGSQGQLLDGDPSYTTYDEQIIKSLGLNYKVVYAGSEAAEETALKQAYAKKAPILMYYWTPVWAQAKYDLTMVQLPTVTQHCSDVAANNKGIGYSCGYPQDVLYKAFNVDLQTKAPAAFAFLSAMNYTNDDQDSIALDVDGNGMTMQAAAQKWIDANQSVWQPWVDAGTAAG
jgi:glycine betaine/proline transport system substrate-binding protein